ncbi:hypothetical protein H6F89_27565 [Cyanobacteria bacterium FACHB-63]|nr:hypothetical protein [Cyanobacteria bacterium FACHB-63]
MQDRFSLRIVYLYAATFRTSDRHWRYDAEMIFYGIGFYAHSSAPSG